jgi:ATP-dependent RNA/DNA helicase IGHMBP2
MNSHMPQLTFGPYRTTRLLSRGAYADVYEAHDDEGARFALKILRLDGVDDSLKDALFRREVAALDGFEHEGIVPLRSALREPDGTLVLAFPLIPGQRTLESLLIRAEEGGESREVSWRLDEAQRLIRAVSAAHGRKVVHRDLKPANILLDVDRDQLLVCDFGVANVLMARVLNPSDLTVRDLFTRPYAAPEQCLRGEALYPADVHALALLVTALLAMRRPRKDFRAGAFESLWTHARDALVAEGCEAEAVSELGGTLQAGLSEDPERRPTMHALSAAVGRVRASITPRPVAVVDLARAATKLDECGMKQVDLETDLNQALAIQLCRDEQGRRIKMFGRSALVVLILDDDDRARPRVIDIKVLSGTKMAHDRRHARAVELVVRFGRGDGSPLVDAAERLEGRVQSDRVKELLETAEHVTELEKERLPTFTVDVEIRNGTPVVEGREARVTQASGFRGPGLDRVRVKNADVRVTSVEKWWPASAKNRVGGSAPRAESLDPASVPSLFRELEEMVVLDLGKGRRLGKVTAWEVCNDGSGAARATIAFDVDGEHARRCKFRIDNKPRRDELERHTEALERLRARRTRLARLPELLTLTSAHALEGRAQIEPIHSFYRDDRRMRDLIERILASMISVVQGPPGTGKTTLIVELVVQLLKVDPNLRILIASQANEAVDNALDRLIGHQVADHLPRRPWVVRDVRKERRREASHDGLESMFRSVGEGWRERAAHHRSELPSARARQAIDHWCRDVQNGAAGTREDFAAHVQVWGATTSRSQRTLATARGEAWDVVILDEAAKITLADTLVPLVDARRAVLVGDHLQLPPFFDSLTAEQLDVSGLDQDRAKRSLFQHLFEDVLPETHRGTLLRQSRMHPTIGDVVSKLFYDGRLQHNVGPSDRPLPAGRFDREHRVLFLGHRGEDEQTQEGSRRNRSEAEAVSRVLKQLDADATRASRKLTVSVITPYKAQARDLEEVLRRAWKSLQEVRAGTVHSFQGRESDVVIYSLVRTGRTEWRFLADPRLFNVAVSRARSLLVLVGDLDGAPATPKLQQLLELLPSENKVSLEDFLG